MKKLIEYIILVPVFLIAVVFMVANRQEVAVSMNPFADGSGFLTSVALPLWAWFMAMIAVGFCLGMVGMWSSGRPVRQNAKEMRVELKALRKEKTEWLASAPVETDDIETLPVLKTD